MPLTIASSVSAFLGPATELGASASSSAVSSAGRAAASSTAESSAPPSWVIADAAARLHIFTRARAAFDVSSPCMHAAHASLAHSLARLRDAAAWLSRCTRDP